MADHITPRFLPRAQAIERARLIYADARAKGTVTDGLDAAAILTLIKIAEVRNPGIVAARAREVGNE
ncbi:hypothetical protein GCM10023157_04260 [Gluconacetobacter asukensis]